MKYFIFSILMVSAFSINAHTDNAHEHNVGHMFSSTTYYTFSGSTTLDDDFVSSESDPSQFIEKNYDQLAESIAKGHGQYVDALGYLMGCSTGSLPRLRESLQKKYSKIFVLKNSKRVNIEMVMSKINHIVDNDESLKSSCQLS